MVIKSKRITWTEHAVHTREMRNIISILKSEGKRSHWRPESEWEDNMKMCPKNKDELMDWIIPGRNMVQWWALMKSVMNLHFP
jgi:hypothetical protein